MAENLNRRITEHINAVSNDPAIPLDHRLFDECELILSKTLDSQQRYSLVTSLSSLLATLQQDPTPAVNLLLRLVVVYSYGEILSLGNVPFTDGLALGEHMLAYNRLILALLEKAAHNAADAASVASMHETVAALVRLWLCTSDAGVASQSSQLLIDLLRTDQAVQTTPDAHLPAGGQGLFWKRVFGDRDVYRTFFEACSLSGPSSIKISKNQRTLAQARLMEWLPKVATIDWSAVFKSHHADVEAEYGVEGGLLDFVTLRVGAELKDDILMRRCLVDFFSDMLHSTAPKEQLPTPLPDSVGLRYLITHGVHTQTAAIYFQLPGSQTDPLEASFLYGPAANYVATYASEYPEHFLLSQMPKQAVERLSTTLDISPGKWAHAESPKHDLHLLASLPRKAILPSSGWSSSPLSLLPSKSTNTDVLNTLATVFHGPPRDIILKPGSALSQEPSAQTTSEAAYARVLYYSYLAANPRFWQDITKHADTVALKDLALSAINCLTAVLTAHWSSTSEIDSSLPTTLATPASGHLALLSPPALEYVLPYLLKPAQSFSNLVGGRGDAESAAFKIAQAKFDALRAFHARLVGEVEARPGEGFEEILATVQKRVVAGPLSREGEVGGKVATMEL